MSNEKNNTTKNTTKNNTTTAKSARASKLFNRDGIDINTARRAVSALEIETADKKRETMLSALSALPTTSIITLSVVKKYGYDFSKSRDGVRVFHNVDGDEVTVIDSWKRSRGARVNLPLTTSETKALLKALKITPFQYNKQKTKTVTLKDGTTKEVAVNPLENLSSSVKKYPSTAYISFSDFERFAVAVVAYLSGADISELTADSKPTASDSKPTADTATDSTPTADSATA